LVLDRDVDRYVALQIGLLIFGFPLAAYSYFILSNVPLLALGLACIILGATAMLIPSSPVPTHTVRAMVEGACVNIEALLEEFDASEKAVYLPPRDGRVYAFVPLRANPGASLAWAAMEAPMRVVTEAGGEPGLMVFPPGSEVVRLSMISPEAGVEEALNHVLVDFLEAVGSVKAVSEGGRVVVDLEKTRFETEFPRFRQVLGSIVVSTSGCVLSTVLGIPVLLQDEQVERGKTRAVFTEVAEGG
jgi:hypothetical protein